MTEQHSLRSQDENEVNEPKYGEILYDRDLYFHGTGYHDRSEQSLIRLQMILEHGILSVGEAERRGLEINNHEPFMNGKWRVSICVSPAIHNTFEIGENHAFPEYIKGSLSFIIKNPNNIITQPPFSTYNSQFISLIRHSGLIDEVFVGNSVKPEAIVGIMIPESWLEKSVSEFGINNESRHINVHDYVKQIAPKIHLYNENGFEIDGLY